MEWGARGEIGELFNDRENVDRADIILWYVSHLPDLALEGSVKWHASSPRIRVVQTTFSHLKHLGEIASIRLHRKPTIRRGTT